MSVKQDLKAQTEAVKKILEIKGESYDEWLLGLSNQYINSNISFLIKKAELSVKGTNNKNLEGVDK